MNQTIEQELIGTMIEFPEVCNGVMLKLKEEDFFGETSKKAFRSIAKQVSRTGSCDISTMDLLDIEKNMLMDWRDMAVSAYGIENKIEYVHNQSEIRKLKKALATAEVALEGGAELSVVREGLQIATTVSSTDHAPYVNSVDIALDITDGEEEEIIRSGFATFDSLIQLSRGQLGVIAARPGVGKSSIARQIALAFAMSGPVLFNSNEMSYREVMKATMSMALRIDSHRMTKSALTDGEKHQIRSLASKIDLRLSEHNTPAQIENTIRVMKAAGELPSVVLVDYIQLLEPSRGTSANRVQDVSAVTRELKVMAQKYDVVIIAMSQFSRDAAKQGEKPQLHHLRESGSIEQDANWVMAIHAEPETWASERELIVLKQRGGSLGSRIVRWFPSYTLMLDI